MKHELREIIDRRAFAVFELVLGVVCIAVAILFLVLPLALPSTNNAVPFFNNRMRVFLNAGELVLFPTTEHYSYNAYVIWLGLPLMVIAAAGSVMAYVSLAYNKPGLRTIVFTFRSVGQVLVYFMIGMQTLNLNPLSLGLASLGAFAYVFILGVRKPDVIIAIASILIGTGVWVSLIYQFAQNYSMNSTNSNDTFTINGYGMAGFWICFILWIAIAFTIIAEVTQTAELTTRYLDKSEIEEIEKSTPAEVKLIGSDGKTMYIERTMIHTSLLFVFEVWFIIEIMVEAWIAWYQVGYRIQPVTTSISSPGPSPFA